MRASYLERRAFLLRGVQVGALAAGTSAATALQPLTRGTSVAGFEDFDDFVGRYLLAMHAPGLTLGLANEESVIGTPGFGYSNVDRRIPVTPDLLFEIGSITKSFVAVALLQLREEGKLDLHRPILDYLPWLPIEANHGVITVHHLLTHTSGLPDALSIFPADPAARHVQASRPGESFHYCNAGFEALGYLVEKLDGRDLAASLHARILEPLGMHASVGAITNETLPKRATSYVPFLDDRSYPRQGELVPAPNIVFTNAAGCLVSTPGDMSLYLQMLLGRGATHNQRILSAESFALFSKPYIKADEFGPTASYGYGIAVDEQDGHKILRHTGGMISFASAIYVDLDAGLAAFASINAMQGFRPTLVTQYAVETLAAHKAGKASPKPPSLAYLLRVGEVARYVGSYRSASGTTAEVSAQGGRLRIAIGSLSTELERASDGLFIASEAGLARFPFIFGQAALASDATDEQRKMAPIAELAHGEDWYVNDHYQGPTAFPAVTGFQAFVGTYRAESAWAGSVRVVLRKGTLWLDGATLLEALGDRLFRVGGPVTNPETAEFFYIAEGKARLLKLSGADLWRVNAS